VARAQAHKRRRRAAQGAGRCGWLGPGADERRQAVAARQAQGTASPGGEALRELARCGGARVRALSGQATAGAEPRRRAAREQ
jgi:hypothetical protein